MEFSFKNVSTSPSSDDTGSEQDVKVLIIGSGPAGLAAALYAARAELEPVVLTGMALGGQVSLTHAVENYPGFPEGIGGMEMVDLFQKQAERFGARLEYDSAAEVDLSNRPFVITTLNGVRYLADTLIITTGASARNLNVPGESELTGRGVSYCGTCDGYFFKDKDVVVVGGGDSAVEEGIFLTRFASSVTIVHRRDELRAGPILESRAKTNPKISFIWNAVVDEIYGNGKVESVKLVDTVTGEERLHPTDGVFIFIGHTPNTDLFKDQLELDERGYIVVDRYMQTNVPGVYAAGEVADSHYRQVITSAGMGAAAAIEAGHFLDGHAERI
jgi:thioredoxin reductase (NADPH)